MVQASSTCDLLFPYASFFIILQQCAKGDQIMLSSSKLTMKFTVETKLSEQAFVLLPYNLIKQEVCRQTLRPCIDMVPCVGVIVDIAHKLLDPYIQLCKSYCAYRILRRLLFVGKDRP